MDFCEPAVELGIRLCGWSAILFVFAIFFFVFREAAPAFWGACASTTARFPGENNNLAVATHDWTRAYNGTEIVFQASDEGSVAFRHDPEEGQLTVEFDPTASTAQDVVDAFATDQLNRLFAVRLTDFDDAPNDGTGLIASTEAVMSMSEQDVAIPGENNNLVFIAREWTEDYADTEIAFSPVEGGPIAFHHNLEEKQLTIDFDPATSTANDLVAAFASDSVHQAFAVRRTDFDDKPNDGSARVTAELQTRAELTGGRPPLDLVEFFTSANWRPDSEVRPQFGILALLVGTLSVTTLAMILAVPLGLGAAVYVSEFAGTRTKETLKVVIELLAAIPSVVWGFIGYMVLGPIIIWATGAPVGINLTNGGIILAMMSVPIIVSVSEDALRAVPDSYREAAVALGASRWEIVYRVLFPAAKNGLLAAVLLGVGRGIGETMAVLMATGHAVQIPHSLLDPVRTLTATIAAELGDAESSGEHYCVLFVIGIVLFAVAFVVNLTADLVVKGIRGGQSD
jgi:phosphate transport system permease protein